MGKYDYIVGEKVVYLRGSLYVKQYEILTITVGASALPEGLYSVKTHDGSIYTVLDEFIMPYSEFRKNKIANFLDHFSTSF